MAEVLLGGAVAAGIAAPHLLRLDRVTPSTAAAVWLLALLLRALVVLGAALFVVADLHSEHGAASVFAIDDWHPHHLLTAVSGTFDVATHSAAHLLALVPVVLVGGALLVFAVGLGRGIWLLRRMLRSSVGDGPHGTRVVSDPRILVAVAGVGRSRILLSDAALAALDPAELAAGVAHEHGHVRRAHRPLLLLAALLAAIAWPLPGTAGARRRFVASLECDADDYAVRATGDRLALASAICKAATTAPLAASSLRGQGSVTLRLERLVGDERRAGPVLEHSSRSLVLLLAILAAVVAEVLVSLVVFMPELAHLMTPADIAAGGH